MAARGSTGVMHKKWYLKDPYADFPPMPFIALDYVLCALVFFLTGIASRPQIASLIASIGSECGAGDSATCGVDVRHQMIGPESPTFLECQAQR
jgi:hypothetical protein